MKFIHYLGLFLLSLTMLIGVSLFQRSPGYMDAEYYFAGSRRLATGHGLNEVILWNYLGDPPVIPYPAFGYWMPLTSLLGAIPMVLFSTFEFVNVKYFYVFLAAFLSPLTAAWMNALTRRKNWAILAGCLATFSGFYLPYLVTSDTFVICMLLGLGWFYLVSLRSGWITNKFSGWLYDYNDLLLGSIAGLFSLARAEGLIWLPLSIWVVSLYPGQSAAEDNKQISIVKNILRTLGGYLFIMTPWLIRNLSVFGEMFSPGGGRAFWLTSYDELFAYPASQLTLNHWLASGWAEILKARMWAFGQNIQTIAIVQGEIILLPLLLICMWNNRERLIYKAAALAWFGLFVMMTVLFPFQGARGGFFHSGAALQPLIWISVPIGLDYFVNWGKKMRGWNAVQAFTIFGISVVGLAALITGVVFSRRVIGPDVRQPLWNSPIENYQRSFDYLASIGIGSQEVVMVNDPPGFFLVSGLPAIVIPNENLDILLQAARRYHARYLLLEFNHPKPLQDVYHFPFEQPGLSLLTDIGGTLIFRIQ